MGFSVGTLHHLTWLGRNGHIPRGCRYLDFGSQNIFGKFPSSKVEDFLAVFSSKDRYSPKLTEPGAKIENLMAAAEIDYVAFDMYAHSKTLRFDLNVESLPESMCGTFDVVANFGTSEHVANQFNVFDVAHGALKVGGVMYNLLPFFGGVDHGLFNYHPKFFTTLIANNAYQPLYWDFSDVYASNEDFYRNVSTAVNGPAWEGKHVGAALMSVIFKKTTSAPFLPPTDSVLAGDVSLGFPSVNQILERVNNNRAQANRTGSTAEVEMLRRELEMIRSSRSWKVTAPLRSFMQWIRRFRT